MSRRPPYPLTAIVGQEDLVEALLVCAVNPVVGGVLVRGERGTAKSTAVRALAPLLGTSAGSQDAVPLVELPLGATLDRVIGTLDLRAALGGEHRFEAGLLGRADGGVLYVDEVNLLGDHLVDVLLDAAASGEVTVERDGVSVVGDARFLLVGTMNPEEGELRPQLLDRFGLGVEVTGPRDAATRARIVRRRMDFDSAPASFAAAWADAERALAERIATARTLVRSVTIAERELLRISSVCARLDLDGVRGDLVCAHAACALAALDRETEVSAAHVERAAHLALRHRLRRDPLAPPPVGGPDPAIAEALDSSDPETDPPGDAAPEPASALAVPEPAPPAEAPAGAHSGAPPPGPGWTPDADLVAPGPPEPPASPADRSELPPHLTHPDALPSRLPAAALVPHAGRRATRRGAPTPALGAAGRSPGGAHVAVDARVAAPEDPISILPTIIAALRGDDRPQTPILGGGRGALLCLIVDTSGSMAAQRRLARVKGALEAALRRAYARRDVAAIIAFSGASAQTLVAPGMPLEQAAAAVRSLEAGGRTPLAAGLAHAEALLKTLPQGSRARIAVLLTDGRAADPQGRACAALTRIVAATDRTVVVDLEEGRVRLGLAGELAAAAGADLTRLVTPGAAEPGRRSAA